ncbi:MAG: hypothetical protein HC866_24665 [Leptolyngbyaceae cyanobacterium RU_5_1]|nr:hypothetical protein [Leptolyngbyaceae cyanobacterium RU_5_1]
MADISGTWLGTYWQQEVPTRFEATLIQGGNAMSGSILDDSALGEAQINGEVIGRRIHFTKRYLTTAGYVISYTGTISEDETFMQGTWRITGLDSGRWEAQRSGENLLADLQFRRAKQLSVVRG